MLIAIKRATIIDSHLKEVPIEVSVVVDIKVHEGATSFWQWLRSQGLDPETQKVWEVAGTDYSRFANEAPRR